MTFSSTLSPRRRSVAAGRPTRFPSRSRFTETTIGIYSPPNRNWAFDTKFRNPTNLPPGTPSVRVLIRGAWAMIAPGTTNVVNPNELIP